MLKFCRIKQSNQETNLIASLRAPVKLQTGQGKYKFSLVESHMILWKMWSEEWWIWLSGAIPRKSVLWVRHRIRRIRNRTSDEEVIKKRKLRNQRENEEKWRRNENDEDGESGKWRKCMFILKWKISTLILHLSLHLSPTVFLVI